MRLVFGRDREVAEFVASGLGVTITPPYVAIGGEKDGKLIIGVVFNNWNGANMEISLYGPGGITRGAIAGVFHYVFKQAKARRLTAITRKSNERMQRMLPRFGFVMETPLRDYYPEEDGIQYVLYPADAQRWISRDG